MYIILFVIIIFLIGAYLLYIHWHKNHKLSIFGVLHINQTMIPIWAIYEEEIVDPL